MKKFLWISAALLLWASGARATCSGAFYNPITDICWSCIFPITLAGVTLSSDGQVDLQGELKDFETCDPFHITCRCGDKCGIPLSFYEPARHYDVAKVPGCFPGLGLEVDLESLPGGITGVAGRTGGAARMHTFNHVNVYVDPLLYWLGVMNDNPCLEQKGFDLLYSTPADICWEDESVCQFLNPESFLFGNMAAVLACTADCVTQTAAHLSNAISDAGRYEIDATYWCAGCNGSSFPLSGHKEFSPGRDISDTQTLGQRMFQKLHREFLVWGTSGPEGLCGDYPKPLMRKTDYKNQMLFPLPETEKITGKCCQTFGVSTSLWGSGKSFPIKGEDYSFMVFRKRDCCFATMGIDQMLGGL